jgi:hypothetical protein
MSTNNDHPSMLWLPADKGKRKWPILGWVFTALFCIQCVARVAIATEEAGNGNYDFLSLLFVGVITDPLMYLWGYLSLCGMEKTAGATVRWKCPHCGYTQAAAETTLNAPLGKVWSCSQCKNQFVKRTTPPT